MQRLKTRGQFQAVLASRAISRTPHFSLHAFSFAATDSGNESLATLFPGADKWLGALVPKRWARRAVTRNSIRRQIYSVSAEYESHLQEGAHLVRLRTAFDRSAFRSATSAELQESVRLELRQLFSRLQNRADKALSGS